MKSLMPSERSFAFIAKSAGGELPDLRRSARAVRPLLRKEVVGLHQVLGLCADWEVDAAGAGRHNLAAARFMEPQTGQRIIASKPRPMSLWRHSKAAGGRHNRRRLSLFPMLWIVNRNILVPLLFMV